jgi:hypothetical protein
VALVCLGKRENRKVVCLGKRENRKVVCLGKQVNRNVVMSALLKRPIGKLVLMVLGGFVAVLLAVDSSWLMDKIPRERTLRVTGSTDPAAGAPESALVPVLVANYVSGNLLSGCTSYSPFSGVGHDILTVRRQAQVHDGRYEVELALKDFTGHTCQYRLTSVSIGIATQGSEPAHWQTLFGFDEEIAARPWPGAAQDTYCFSPQRAVYGLASWYCSGKAEAQTPVGFHLDSMPNALVLNLHRQVKLPYTPIF